MEKRLVEVVVYCSFYVSQAKEWEHPKTNFQPEFVLLLKFAWHKVLRVFYAKSFPMEWNPSLTIHNTRTQHTHIQLLSRERYMHKFFLQNFSLLYKRDIMLKLHYYYMFVYFVSVCGLRARLFGLLITAPVSNIILWNSEDRECSFLVIFFSFTLSEELT